MDEKQREDDTAVLAALDEVEELLEQNQAAEDRLREKRKELDAQRTLPCEACDDAHQIQDTTLVQKYFYIRPHGCTGGDYWKRGELQFICPEEHVRNRLLFFTGEESTAEYGRRFRNRYGALFNEIEELRGDPDRDFVNNRYLDEHKEEWGLT